MLKKFLKFLMYALIIALISGLVIAVFILLGRPVEQAFIVLGALFGVYFSYLIGRKLYVRWRARSQVKRVINEGHPDEEDDLGMTPKELIGSLKSGWRSAIGSIKKSNLRLKGDPLYVLPWYMVIGKPRSGKSTALKNAKLLLPDIDIPKQGEGSTLNLDWWLYEQAIVLDTAGRYAVPDNTKRDKKEWGTLLSMLSRHKQKEPINGVVLVIAANRLLENTEDELMEEGRQVRASINELMEKLEVKVPVYLMITKCDLIEGFKDWSDYLPEESTLQAMGHLHEGELLNLDAHLDNIFDSIVDRMKELRILMLERSQSHNDTLLTLPSKLEGLRRGLHIFIGTALKENPYQDTPRFRGLFLSSSQYISDDKGELESRGLFLHEFFSRVLPADRDLLDSLPSAERLRRAVREYAISIGGGVTLLTLAVISILFGRDMATLNDIADSYPEINIEKQDVNQRLIELYTLRSLILDLQEAQDEWIIPWYGRLGYTPQVQQLTASYNGSVQEILNEALDEPLAKNMIDLQSSTSSIAGGLIRRINLLSTRLDPEQEESLEDKPPISPEYLVSVNEEISQESAGYFQELYVSYLQWHNNESELLEERAALQGAFVTLIKRNHGNYSWIIDWANQQGIQPVVLSDFWPGSIKLRDAPEIDAAFTKEGREFLNEFLAELEEANDDASRLSMVKSDFEEYYRREYVEAWVAFAERFDEGKLQLRNRKEWLTAVDIMSSRENPYFTFMGRMVRELEPLEHYDELEGSVMFEFFLEVQAFTGADVDSGGSNKQAAKMGLKLLGKMGKVGKALAKAGKQGMKANKKLNKGKKKGGVDLDSGIVDEASAVLDEYKAALSDAAFNSEAKSQSYSSISTLFETPDNPGGGNGPPAAAWNAIKKMQQLTGKPRPSTRLFWQLYSGPLSVVHDYMEQETNCQLQDRWESEVLAEVVGVSQNKLGEVLIGEGGLVWNFVENTASPFLNKRVKTGYVPATANKRRINWSDDFLGFLNEAASGQYIVGNEFNVQINTLPTGVNINAAISPYATFLELHCAGGIQTLSNFNYSDGYDFKWSLEECGDVSLQIDIGPVSLRKHYRGVKGFSKFLADFQDGRRIFTADEFPNQASQLSNENVTAIDVNYEIFGQEPVIQVLNSVPLEPPRNIAACWP